MAVSIPCGRLVSYLMPQTDLTLVWPCIFLLSIYFALSANKSQMKRLYLAVGTGGLERALQIKGCEINTQSDVQLAFGPKLCRVCPS